MSDKPNQPDVNEGAERAAWERPQMTLLKAADAELGASVNVDANNTAS